MPKVSIIVPVYNAENVLARCVDSVLGQDFRDFELLLVDDGSADSSPRICDEYAARDARVRVLHRANAGVSAARNAALDAATGKYLQFLDADDWVTPDSTARFVEAVESHECDLVIADFYRVVDDWASHKGDIDAEGVITREQYADFMLEDPANYYYGVIWNKFFKRDLVERYGLRMDPELDWCEDFIFNMEYILHAEGIFPLHAPVYYYVRTEGSLVRQGLNVSDVVRMKLNVIEYYNDFYRSLYDEADYQTRRFAIARFLVEFARDDAAIPGLPSTKRLGLARDLPFAEGLGEAPALSELFVQNRLLDRELTAVALRWELELKDVKLLLFLKNADETAGMKEAASFVATSTLSVVRSLQKLLARKFVQLDATSMLALDAASTRGPRHLAESSTWVAGVALAPSSELLLRDLDRALEAYDSARLAGLSKEETQNFRALAARVAASARAALEEQAQAG